jgi:hypothetical protein
MKSAKPGHVQFTSDEVEWLHAVILNACRIAKRAGLKCDPIDQAHRILDKLDRARFEDAVEVIVTGPELEDEIMKAAVKAKS